MKKISLEDVWRLLHSSAGVDERSAAGADDDDRAFEELGYDSLAILEVSSRIEQEFGVRIHDDDLAGLTSPAALVEYVNLRVLTA